MSSSASDLRRMLWLLYADVNTRVNLMVDECAHLQETIHSHLASTDSSVLGLSETRSRDGTQQRAWFPQKSNPREDAYYHRTPQERALINLWVAMGSLAHALEKNQSELRDLFRAAMGSAPVQDSEAVYWFVSLRGHFLNSVFPLHLQHIQHAHEKLVQLLENMPGVLPGPTLMRRWSSGGYGEFLSEFSRHVNWKTQDLYWRFCVNLDTTGGEFRAWRSKQFLVHAWSHFPTSNTRLTKVNSQHDDKKELQSITTIWSSYFYLEQPILFPLLYHECSHHLSDHDPREHSTTSDPKVEGRRSLWFERPRAAAELLLRVAPFEAEDQYFWKRYVGEIWADTISLALCGDGFLSALALQIIGLTGDDKSFSDFDISVDARIPLDETGQRSRRIRSAQYPREDPAYFWEARLRLAMRAYKVLYPNRRHPWIDGIRALLDRWSDSGNSAMSERVASREHQDQWRYREKLNEWVENVIWSHVCDFAERLQTFDETKPPGFDRDYTLGPEVLDLVKKSVEIQRDQFICQDGPCDLFKCADPGDKRDWILSDLCTHLRWQLSGAIASRYPDEAEEASREEKWTVAYADYLPSEGSIAFRAGLEWVQTLRDIVKTAAWILKSEPQEIRSTRRQLPVHERRFLYKVIAATLVDYATEHRSKSKLECANNLARRMFVTRESEWPRLTAVVNAFKVRLATRLGASLSNGEIRAGTFTLGVIRPLYAHQSHGYGQALLRLDDYLKKSLAIREALLRRSGFGVPDARAEFMPLFGEYTFAAYQSGFTPVEKDIHPKDPGPWTRKTRAVVQVGTMNGRPRCTLSFVRVSQVGFKFRWQWVTLAEALNGQADIYLSSAWEDVVLITYHETYGHYDDMLRKHGLGHRPWQDIHSSVGLPGLPQSTAQPPANPTSASFVDAVNATLFANAHTRTGRYDVVVEWKADSVIQLWQRHNSLHHGEWSKVESIVTSMSHPCANEHKLSSQVILRHDKH